RTYEPAWDSVRVKDRIYGLPFCAEMPLRYINEDLATTGTLFPASKQTGSKATESSDKWDAFTDGEISALQADSSHLPQLVQNPPAFSWRAEPLNGHTGGYETLALVV